MAFDALAFARRLTDAGFTEAQAEAIAEVTRDLALDQMITRAFLHVELEWLARRFAFRIAFRGCLHRRSGRDPQTLAAFRSRRVSGVLNAGRACLPGCRGIIFYHSAIPPPI